jgi:hypothetical protein
LIQCAGESIKEIEMQVSEATLCFVASQDLTLNKRDGWRANDMARNLHRLMEFGAVEVGWRESCGSTDGTAYKARAWKKIVARLKKDGLKIEELPVKHGNGYATMKGGFWSSIIYSIDK